MKIQNSKPSMPGVGKPVTSLMGVMGKAKPMKMNVSANGMTNVPLTCCKEKMGTKNC